jgi:hypothetical protein
MKTLYVVIYDEPADPPPVCLGVFDTLDQAYAQCHEHWEEISGSKQELEFKSDWDGVAERRMTDPQWGETVYIIQEVNYG